MECLNCGHENDSQKVEPESMYNDSLICSFVCPNCNHRNLVSYAPGYVTTTYKIKEE